MAKTVSPKIISQKHLARLEREHRQRKILLIGVGIIAAAIVLLLGYGILDQNVLKDLRPVAKVGDQKILVKDYKKRVQFNRYQLIQQYTSYAEFVSMFGADQTFAGQFTSQMQQIQTQLDPANAITLGDNAVTQMVDELVIEREAQKRGITVSDAEVNKEMETAFAFFPDGTPTPTITPTTAATSTLSPLQQTVSAPTLTPTVDVKAPTATATPTEEPTPTEVPPTPGPTATEGPTSTPEPTSTPYTREGYEKRVGEYVDLLKDYNFTQDDIRKVIYNQLLRQKVMDAVLADLKPEEEQVWARHILVKDEAIANALLDRLKKGEDFAALAAEASMDESNKMQGGDLGWFGKGQMVSEFETAAFSLKEGEVSQPVKTDFGWHIIQVIGHEVRPLSSYDFTEMKNTKFQEFLDTQREGEDIVMYEETWAAVVPTEPVIPAELLQQFSQQ